MFTPGTIWNRVFSLRLTLVPAPTRRVCLFGPNDVNALNPLQTFQSEICSDHTTQSKLGKTQRDCVGIWTGPLRRAAADVINGVWWIMSILCDWTEPAESLKVREEHNADCCPKTAHWSSSDRGHLVEDTLGGQVISLCQRRCLLSKSHSSQREKKWMEFILFGHFD